MVEQNQGLPTAAAMVSAKDLQRAVADLQQVRPGPGLLKMAICAVLTLPPLFMALTSPDWLATCGYGLVAGTFLAAWMITTHDAIHSTLTGLTWFDELAPRLLSWPILWFHGTYAEVHKIHHKMNGDDFNDPERVQWTLEEYQNASALGRFYVRHQWVIDIFVLGAFGLIYKTVREAVRFAPKSKALRRQLALDLAGIAVGTVVLYSFAASYGASYLHTFVVWMMLERMTGAVLQWRAHVEHYGLWGKGRNYFETQSYTCRNLSSNAIGSWFFNRLNFHSVHHAFPRVPFYALGTAHQRFQELYRQAGGEPLVDEASYFAVTIAHARQPSVIGPVDAASPSRRRSMQSIAGL